jgi:eukaryotic-like serine/threonine-protein kinase
VKRALFPSCPILTFAFSTTLASRKGPTFWCLQYLDGETLGASVRRGPLAADHALKYGAQMAEALDKAHRHGVIHRDLKPANVIRTKSGVKPALSAGMASKK